MSAFNGDKSRFNRDRKKKIARRARNLKQFKDLAAQMKQAPQAAAKKQKEVSV